MDRESETFTYFYIYIYICDGVISDLVPYFENYENKTPFIWQKKLKPVQLFTLNQTQSHQSAVISWC